MYYIWEDSLSHDFHGMKKEDYDKVIWNARAKLTFSRADGFTSIDEVADYVRTYMTFFDDARFVLQCDRRGGSDFITNAVGVELCNESFVNDAMIELFGYSKANGSVTDVMELKERGLKVCACNISCGYYNPHSDSEATKVSELRNCLDLVCNIIDNCTDVYPHEYERKAFSYNRYYGNYNPYRHDDWYDDKKDDDSKPMRYTISLKDIEDLLEQASKDKEVVREYANWISGDYDYYDCNNLMQYVLFKEVVYG